MINSMDNNELNCKSMKKTEPVHEHNWEEMKIKNMYICKSCKKVTFEIKP